MKIEQVQGGWLSKAFNLSVLQNRRLDWIDYLRGIAIVLVVYHHVRVGIERSDIAVPQALVNANMILYSFRMPLFFILSGILISHTMIKKTIKELVWIRFERLLYPYLIWAFIQVSLQIALSDFTNSSRGPIDYTYILYHPRNLDQFWYLPALFNATMFYLFVRTKINPSTLAHIAIALVLYFSAPFFQKASMVSDWMTFYIFFALGEAGSRLFFKETTQAWLKKPLSLLVVIPLFVVAQLYYLKYDIGGQTLQTEFHGTGIAYLMRMLNQLQFLMIALIGCLTMFLLAFRLQAWNIMHFLRVLGYHSLYIYVMHVMVIAFMRMAVTKVLGIHDPIVLLIAGTLSGLIVPIVVYNLLIRNNIGWFLFSLERKPPKQPPVEEVKRKEMTMNTSMSSPTSV
jgi:fucose 4-O-acetylase-like acetyltransferase